MDATVKEKEEEEGLHPSAAFPLVDLHRRALSV